MNTLQKQAYLMGYMDKEAQGEQKRDWSAAAKKYAKNRRLQLEAMGEQAGSMFDVSDFVSGMSKDRGSAYQKMIDKLRADEPVLRKAKDKEHADWIKAGRPGFSIN